MVIKFESELFYFCAALQDKYMLGVKEEIHTNADKMYFIVNI